MKPRHLLPVLTIAAAALAACGQMSDRSASAASSTTETEAVVLVSPSASELQSGCWATFFGDRSFNGDSLTLIGPIELQTLDKGSARQLRRDIRSVITGPRATLIVYQKQFLSARSVGFPPDSREPGLVEKLGFGGRIESLQLRCT
ncbi:MAG TPA: hypothetical protein VGO85_07105 [Caldimonas sp.]|jgi:hypothetical protein|nr:hypothetical protein [Caldimonas sp.]